MHAINHESNNRLSHYDDILATAVGSVPDVVRLLLLPCTLSADYPIRPQTSLADPRALGGVLLLACWTLGTLVLIRRAPVAAFSSAWTLITFVPCSNIFPLTLHFVAERYLYVPSFGVCLLAAIGIERIFTSARRHYCAWLPIGASTIVALIIVMGGACSVARNRDWRNDLTLWSSALRAGMETHRIHSGLAKALLEQGRTGEAIQHLYRGLEVHRCDSRQKELIGVLVSVGRVYEAAEQCRERLKRFPNDAKCRALLDENLRRGND